MTEPLRADLSVIATMITPGTTVLDIGCGEGELLDWLGREKQVKGRGIDVLPRNVTHAIEKGLYVVQGDADDDLPYYPAGVYDYVIACNTLQAMKEPEKVLREMARIGKEIIVSVPNFGNWKNRFYLGINGRMPVTKKLSYQWYETPNIHFCTISDFIDLCHAVDLRIVKRLAMYPGGKASSFIGHSPRANILGEQGIFLLRKD